MPGFINLTDEQIQAIQSIITAAFGFGSAFGVQWIQKRKSSRDLTNESTSIITQAAGENVKTAQQLIDLLQEMLEEQSKRFDERIEEAKNKCNEQIEKLKIEYESTIEEMESRIIRLTNENASLNHQITKLTFERSTQDRQIEELMAGLLAKIGIHDEKIGKMLNQNNPTSDLKLDDDE